MTRRAFLIAAAAPAAAAWAAGKPDFSGEWKLIPESTDYGGMPMPEKLVYKVEHAEPKLKMHTVQSTQRGEMEADLAYTTDGEECQNTLRGNPLKTRVTWDGETLVFDSKIDYQGNAVALVDRWTLAGEGRKLEIARALGAPRGEVKMKIAMAKQ